MATVLYTDYIILCCMLCQDGDCDVMVRTLYVVVRKCVAMHRSVYKVIATLYHPLNQVYQGCDGKECLQESHRTVPVL